MTEVKTSMLAKLTAEVAGEKKAAALPKRSLTPVEGERAASLPHDTGMFMSNEVLRDHAKALRKFAADAIAIADGVDAIVGETSEQPVVVDLNSVRKEKERDADFKADFRAKQNAAQAATFDPEEPATTSEDLGWVCPEHGRAIAKRSVKTGRDFIGCPDCNLFKR